MQWKTSIVFSFSPTQGVSFFRQLKSERNFPEQKMNTIVLFFLGGADFTKGSKPVYSKTENFTDLSHYFFFGGGEELNFTFETKHTQMSDLPPAGDPTKSSKIWPKMIFLCGRQMCVFNVWKLFLNRIRRRTHPISGSFWVSEENFEILGLIGKSKK